MVTPTSLSTSITAGTTGAIANTNIVHGAVNALTGSAAIVTVVQVATKAGVEDAITRASEGGTVYFPDGSYDWAGDVTVTKRRLTFTGPGIIAGRFKVGSGASKLELNIRFRDLRFVRALSVGTYPVTGYAAGSYFIGIDRVRDVTIEGCEFYGAAWPVYVMPNASAASHDNQLIRVINNRFAECDWAMYSTFHASSVWQSFTDSSFMDNIILTSYVGMFYAQGIDGAQISNNVAFMLNYGQTTHARFPEKQQNIRVDWSDWLHIHDNNLFEAGTESILLTNARTYDITGNLIAWSGQRVFSNAIDVTASASGEWAQGVVTGNGIMYYTRSAIRLAGNHGEMQLGPNPIRYDAASLKYVGDLDGSSLATQLPALSSINHYRYDMSGVTGIKTGDIGIADATFVKTGHYDSFPGHTYIHSVQRLDAWGVQGGGFRGVLTFVAVTGQSIAALTDTEDANTTYQGELTIVAKFGSSSTAKTSIYKLLISKTAATTDITTINSLGYLTGAAADDPSFTWSIASNALVATPVGLTAGGYTFSFIFSGNLMVG